jgi:RimJ/RimL family protein N-acetyltransferase
MRGAVLSFAFDALGAEAAISGAYAYNLGSIRVSEKLGYARNGVRLDTVRGQAVEAVLFRVTRRTWLSDPPFVVQVRGLETCVDMFGVS